MADVFISYKSERRAAARHLEQILIRYGYSVWFDHALVRGADYEAQIEREIRQATAVVVLWCDLSVKSEPVRSEANWAKGKGKLIPLKIEACEMPLFSTLTQHIDLTTASCSPRDSALDLLLDDVERLVGRAPQPDYRALRAYEATWRSMGAFTFAGFPLEEKAVREVVLVLDDGAGVSPSVPPNPFTPTPPPTAEDAYATIKDSDDPADWERFVADYPDSGLAIVAKSRARQLRAQREQAAKPVSREAEAAEVWHHLKDIDDSQAIGDFHKRYQGTVAWEKAAEQNGYVVARVGFGGTNDELRLLIPGDTFKDADFAPEMVVVPPGSFMMGSKNGEGSDSERPQHKVTIAQPFAVSAAPITRGQFTAFINEKKHDMSGGAFGLVGTDTKNDDKISWLNPGFKQCDDHPVVCVSWNDARSYIEWLSTNTGGKLYWLLSEAQWEYCCRAGTATAYSTGTTIVPKQANFGRNEQGTTPVKEYEPNSFGLYDMHGNVWEWCQDNWHQNYKDDPPQNGTVWLDGLRSNPVKRGGSWGIDSAWLRSAHRAFHHSEYRSYNLGFRLARMLTP